MKTKILMLFALLSSFCYEAIAGPTITMQGGGRNQRFDYVQASNRHITCRGCGSLICPVVWETVFQKGVTYPVNEVVDFVSKQINAGDKSGDAMYANAFKVSWESIEDGFQIELDVEGFSEGSHD